MFTTTRSLTWRYVAALAGVAVLAIVGQLLVQVSLSQQAVEGRVINVAGRQRMLSQRMAKEALAAASAVRPETRTAYADSLRATLPVWRRAQRGLRDGDPGLGLPGTDSPAVTARLDALVPSARRLDGAASHVLAELDAIERADPNSGPASGLRARLEPALQALLLAEQQYLRRMNRVVFQYDRESAAAVRQLRRIEAWLLVVTLLVLLGEGLFVFRPGVARIRDALGRLGEAHDALAESHAAAVATNVDLAEARRLAGAAERTKASILANMSHEIRTPLTGILGYAELLRAEADESFDDLIDPIERGSRRLLNALDAILDLARLEVGAVSPAETQRVDVAREAEGVAALFQADAARKGLSLEVEGPPGLGVDVDRSALTRALANVVHNAVRFTLHGGVRVHVRPAAGGVEIRVEDSGPGIDPAFLPRLFEAFEQASSGHARAHEGVGIGLAVTDRLMRSVGGTVSIESAPGRGTAVVLWLPAARPRVGPSQASPGAEGAGPEEAEARVRTSLPPLVAHPEPTA